MEQHGHDDYTMILDNGQQMDLPQMEAETLSRQGLIYYCPECGVWHIAPEHTWDDIPIWEER